VKFDVEIVNKAEVFFFVSLTNRESFNLLSKIKKANFFNEIKDQVTVSVSYELTKKIFV